MQAPWQIPSIYNCQTDTPLPPPHTDVFPSHLHPCRYTWVQIHIFTPICTPNTHTHIYMHSTPLCRYTQIQTHTYTFICTPNTHAHTCTKIHNLHTPGQIYIHIPVQIHLDTGTPPHTPSCPPHTHRCTDTPSYRHIATQTYISYLYIPL